MKACIVPTKKTQAACPFQADWRGLCKTHDPDATFARQHPKYRKYLLALPLVQEAMKTPRPTQTKSGKAPKKVASPGRGEIARVVPPSQPIGTTVSNFTGRTSQRELLGISRPAAQAPTQAPVKVTPAKTTTPAKSASSSKAVDDVEIEYLVRRARALLTQERDKVWEIKVRVVLEDIVRLGP